MPKLKRKGRVRSSMKSEGSSIEEDEVVIPPMDEIVEGEPHSNVGVTLGYRKSRDYQSVMMDVTVELPCKVGNEKRALRRATGIADRWLEENQASLDAALRGLA